MGLFDQMIGGLVSNVIGQIGKGGAVEGLLNTVLNSPMASALPGWIDSTLAKTPFGGIEGFADRLREGGLSDALDSWISTGPNLPVGASEIVAALGDGQIEQLSSAFGISADRLPELLAQFLPVIIDRLSPDGVFEVPEKS